MSVDKSCKSWSFTLNNYAPEDCTLLDNLVCNYVIYGKEIGEKGTPHLQGCVIFKKSCRLSSLKKILPKAHWEPTKCIDASINYCMKDKAYMIHDHRQQGKRTDLAACVEALGRGGIKTLVTEQPEAYIKYHSGLEKLNYRLSKPRDPKCPPIVTWLYGKTGTGKTRQVVEKEPDLWISGRDLKFWDGYENQEAVLFDDFRKDFCTFHELLRILDRYPINVNVKGGFRCFNSKRIYITSCFKPEYVYETREDVKQLLRRITFVTEVKSAIAASVTDVTEVAEGNTKLQPIQEKFTEKIDEHGDLICYIDE